MGKGNLPFIKIFCFIILSSSLFSSLGFASTNLGPFVPYPAFAFYWVDRPATCSTSLLLSLVDSTSPETALIRVYDRNSDNKEKLDFEQTITLPAGASSQSIPLTFASTPLHITEIRVAVGSNNLNVTVVPSCTIADYGVSFQNGTYSSWSGAPTSLYAYIPWAAEPLTFENQLAQITAMGVGTNGKEKDSVGPVGSPVTLSAHTTATLTPTHVSWEGTGASSVLWQFNFSKAKWTFRATGFPLILCSNEATANSLKAGLIFDGKHILAHPLQNTIVNTLIPQLTSYVSSASSELSLFSQISSQRQLLQFPDSFLLSEYGPLFDLSYALTYQNLLTGSDWFGSSAGWQYRDPATNNPNTPILQPSGSVSWTASGETVTGPLVDPQRWDRLAAALASGSAPEMQLTASTYDGTATSGLAIMAMLDGSKSTVPWTNPFLFKKDLIYKAALAALRDLGALQPSEIWINSSTMLSTYAGGEAAFLAARQIFPNYGKVGFMLRRLFCASSPTSSEKKLYNCTQVNKIAPMSGTELASWNFSATEVTLWKDVFAAWTQTLERFAYRMWPNNMVDWRNQSSHWLLAFQLLAEGSGNSFDQSLASGYSQRWIAGQDPAGWNMENMGPDGSYSGMSNYHTASYYLETCLMGSCDKAMATSIAKAYNFWNYTVAPEPVPAGSTAVPAMMAGFPFNHRVGQGFDMEFWAGARAITPNLPEVSAWNPVVDLPVSGMPSFSAASSGNLDFNVNRYIGTLQFAAASATPWPALSSEDFTTDVNNAGEMIAVKRQGYYTAIYVSHPATDEKYIESLSDIEQRLAWPNNAESTGCKVGNPDGSWYAPYVGGGVTLFWTPDYGSALLAGNWTPLVHHGLVVTDGQTGVRTAEDYFTVNHSLSGNTLTVSGNLESAGPTTATHLQPAVNLGYTMRSSCGYPTPPATSLQSNVSGLSYNRGYNFGEQAMVINLSVSAASNAVIPAGTTMIENIPVSGGTSKAVVGQPVFYLPGAPSSPIANNTVVNAAEIDIRGANTAAGIRIVFNGNYNVTVVSNGPISPYRNLQINRLQVALAVPAAGQTTQLQYCVESLTQSVEDCGF
jgi:hypothetical protein